VLAPGSLPLLYADLHLHVLFGGCIVFAFCCLFFFLTLMLKTAINIGHQQELTAVPSPVTLPQPFLMYY